MRDIHFDLTLLENRPLNDHGVELMHPKSLTLSRLGRPTALSP